MIMTTIFVIGLCTDKYFTFDLSFTDPCLEVLALARTNTLAIARVLSRAEEALAQSFTQVKLN